jgi:hypothetical protein
LVRKINLHPPGRVPMWWDLRFGGSFLEMFFENPSRNHSNLSHPSPLVYVHIAAACGQLELKPDAAAAISGLRRHSPAFLDLTVVREDAEK